MLETTRHARAYANRGCSIAPVHTAMASFETAVLSVLVEARRVR
jgi:hypothetical protein